MLTTNQKLLYPENPHLNLMKIKHFKTVKQKHPKIKESELKNMCKGILFTEKGRLNLTNR